MKHPLLGVIFIAIAIVTASAIPEREATAASNRIDWDGQSRFVAGANMPWYNWGCDFGCGTSGGVVQNQAAISARIGQMRATGMEVIRWWVFEPGGSNGAIWQIAPGAGGQLQINPAVYTDMDAALAIAEARDVYLIFNLFAGVGPENMPSAWVNDASMRQQLTNALAPMFVRYGNNPRLMAWDIFNEPEWQIWNGQANQANAVALADLIADRIQVSGNTLVTIGEAMLDGIPIWDDAVSLDFHSPHWYSYMESGDWCASCRTYASAATQFGTTKPIVIGEWDAANRSTTLARWNHWKNAGYAGAWAWSIFPERTGDNIPFGFNTATQFISANPTPTVTTTPTATKTGTPTTTVTATTLPTVTVTSTATVAATPIPTPLASATPTATATAGVTAECQGRFRHRSGNGWIERWQPVDCQTGALKGPIRP